MLILLNPSEYIGDYTRREMVMKPMEVCVKDNRKNISTAALACSRYVLHRLDIEI